MSCACLTQPSLHTDFTSTKRYGRKYNFEFIVESNGKSLSWYCTHCGCLSFMLLFFKTNVCSLRLNILTVVCATGWVCGLCKRESLSWIYTLTSLPYILYILDCDVFLQNCKLSYWQFSISCIVIWTLIGKKSDVVLLLRCIYETLNQLFTLFLLQQLGVCHI